MKSNAAQGKSNKEQPCTCNERRLDPYCKFHTAQHNALRESGAFDTTSRDLSQPQPADVPKEHEHNFVAKGIDMGEWIKTVIVCARCGQPPKEALPNQSSPESTTAPAAKRFHELPESDQGKLIGQATEASIEEQRELLAGASNGNGSGAEERASSLNPDSEQQPATLRAEIEQLAIRLRNVASDAGWDRLLDQLTQLVEHESNKREQEVLIWVLVMIPKPDWAALTKRLVELNHPSKDSQ